MKVSSTRIRIRLLSEAPIEQVWSYLSLWESEQAARRLLDERVKGGEAATREDRLVEKARGLAYCLRNARECLCLKEEAWIPRIVSKYYGTMWLLSAIMVVDPASPYDLRKLERQTKMGQRKLVQIRPHRAPRGRQPNRGGKSGAKLRGCTTDVVGITRQLSSTLGTG